jgi:hypothetical protein
VRVYDATTANPTTQVGTWTSPQLGATQLDANQWTVGLYLQRGGAGTASRVIWGTATYNCSIAGFRYTSASVRDPYQDNTLNWTASVSADTDHYNIYRSAAGSDAAYSVINTVPYGTNTYCDSLYGNADATLWYYYVTAVDDATNEGVGTTHLQELGGGSPAYDIDLTGKAANSWVFVSFPIAVSGNIQTILADATLGDGSTTWTVAKWYNPQTPADPWKTYRVGSTTNDLTTISNAMGVWLWITANGGDFQLTTGVTGGYSASNVVVNLYTGWNLVGYPSATSRAETATLTNAAIDYVAVWQAGTPYITEHAKGASMMVEGNAYFVHSTADVTWTVVP